MGWPRSDEYHAAIQSPGICFEDPELRGGDTVVDKLGLPVVMSGTFALVYQVTCGPRRWAVRCFSKEVKDQQRRYAAISAQLKSTPLTCMVAFEYIEKGIRIQGRWYPILKMEWIEGVPLPEFIQRHLHDPAMLQKLIRHWLEVISMLQKFGIAHGDLQHGNILVSGQRLKLIDYDGMYVPALAGLGKTEDGHPNYQHPARKHSKAFDGHLDNFSAWIVFISLCAISVEPRLWQLLKAGDDCLLFRESDFVNPESSLALQSIERSGNPQLQGLARHFRALLTFPVSQIPSLSGQQPLPVPSTSIPAAPTPSNVPSWLEGHVPRQSTPNPVKHDLVIEPLKMFSASASWILDHLQTAEVKPIPFSKWMIPERMGVAVQLIVVAASAFFGYMVGPLYGLLTIVFFLLLTFTYLRLCYVNTPAAKAYRSHAKRLKDCVQRRDLQNLASQELHEKRLKLQEPLRRIKAEYEKVGGNQNSETEHAKAVMHQTETRIAREIQELNNSEIERVEHLERHWGTQKNQFIRELNSLAADEQREIDAAMSQFATTFIQNALRNANIQCAQIRGIPQSVIAELNRVGIYSAAEIETLKFRKVDGVGDVRYARLMAWRNEVEQKARLEFRASNALGSGYVVGINRKYEHRKRDLQRQIDSCGGQLDSQRRTLLTQTASERRGLEDRRQQERMKFNNFTLAVERKYAAEKSRLATLFNQTKVKVNAAIKETDGEFQALNQSVADCEGALSQCQAEKASLRRHSFSAFLFHVYGLRKSA